MRKDWSIVLPARTNPRETGFFRRMFPYMMNLGADDVVVVLDEPFGDPAKYEIPRLAKKYGARIVEVGGHDGWNFRQAFVRRVGYEEAKYDRILTMDDDVVPRPCLLKGYDMVGTNQVALVSFCKMLQYKPPQFMRNFWYYLNQRVKAFRFHGIYWLYRPWYLELMPRSDVAQIYNGEDTMVLERLLNSNKFQLRMLKDIGCWTLSDQNEDLPWRQFLDGVWTCMHRKDRRRKGVWGRIRESKAVTIPLGVGKTVILDKPHMTKGYIWAKHHRGDPICQEALRTDTLWHFQFKGNISRGYGSS